MYELDLYRKVFKAVHLKLLDGVDKYGQKHKKAFSPQEGVSLFDGTCVKRSINTGNWSVAYCEVVLHATLKLEALGILKVEDVVKLVNKAKEDHKKEVAEKEAENKRSVKSVKSVSK